MGSGVSLDVLSVVWWVAASGGVVALAFAVFAPRRRREALYLSAVMFLVAGVLGILSVGVVFLLAAVGVVVVATRHEDAPS